jgi:beta-galactosidase
MPRSAQEKDAEILKYDLACNVVRTSHYPQSRHFLNRCDEIGLLVFEEIPGWQHIGDEDWKALALTHVREMITEDWNHPSIILWGVRINESPDDDAFYAATNDLARRLDGTRPTGGVRNFAKSHVFEDVYTYNDFVHTGENRALDPPEKIAGQKMPYLVTEHNGHMFPTKKFDDASKRLEQALRHARVLDEMYRSEGISGAIGWCLFDYNTHRDFGSGDSICHHGVLDMFRIPKLAASVYSAQGTERPVLEISSNMEIGEYPGGLLRKVYAFTNCDAVDLYKNGTFIKRFARDEKLLPGLPKSPIPIDDLIGNRLHDQEPFSEKDADLLKEILLKVGALGLEGLSLKDKAKMGYVMAKNRLTMEDGARLFTTYIGNWGGEAVVYRFVGIVADEEVITVEKGPSADLHLQVSADCTHLIHGDTYDVSRVVIRAVNAYGSDALYYEDVITAAVTGPLEILGPSTVSLIGGSRALWVRSTGEGTGELTLTSARLGERVLTFAVDLSEPTWRA